MALELPPQHLIDAPARWISNADKALDQLRFKEEDDRIEAAFIERVAARAVESGRPSKELYEELAHERPQHPLVRYYLGETRFDLDAPLPIPEGVREDGKTTVTVRDYLTGEPVIFELRQLGARDQAKVETAGGEKSPTALLLAVKLGLAGITGGEADGLIWKRDTEGHRGVHDDVLDRLSLVPGLIRKLGVAVLLRSQALTPAEKKR